MSGRSGSGIPFINTGEPAKKVPSISAEELTVDTTPKTPGTCYRDGEYLVVAGTGTVDLLLDRCIKTNEEPTERRTFSASFPHGVRRGSLVGVGMLASGMQVGVTVTYPIGATWLMRQRIYLVAAFAATILGVLMFAPMLSMGARSHFWESIVQFGCYAGVGLFCTGLALLYWQLKSPVLFPIKEQGGYTWFLGAGKPLLASLPPRPGTRG